jgi:hypothetical protein
MPVHHTLNLKLVGAAGVALTLTAAVALPALAAGGFRASTTYSCGPDTVVAAVSFAVKTPPRSMAAGQTVKVPDASTVTIDAEGTGFLHDVLMWRTFDGSLTDPTAPYSGLKLTIPMTKVSKTGTTTAHATGNALLRATQTGTYTVRFGDVAARLQGYNADGTKDGHALVFDNSVAGAPQSCANTHGVTIPKSAGGKPARVLVVKDTTSTRVSASYAKAKHLIRATAKVRSRFGLKPTGSAKLTLKKGSHTIKTVTARLNKKGIASAVFKGVRKAGKYTVKASYGGNPALRPSTGSKSLTVG